MIRFGHQLDERLVNAAKVLFEPFYFPFQLPNRVGLISPSAHRAVQVGRCPLHFVGGFGHRHRRLLQHRQNVAHLVGDQQIEIEIAADEFGRLRVIKQRAHAVESEPNRLT